MTTPNDELDTGGENLESEVRDMQLKEEDGDVDMDTTAVAEGGLESQGATAVLDTTPSADTPTSFKRQSRSPLKNESMSQSPAIKDDTETVGGDVTLKLEPGLPPKLSRTTTRKVERRPPSLFIDYEDKTEEAKSTFSILEQCVYANKYMGSTEPALECDCAEEWGKLPPRLYQRLLDL